VLLCSSDNGTDESISRSVFLEPSASAAAESESTEQIAHDKGFLV